jgi:two-component system nitrogen regulation response regulator GlnG
LAKIRVENPDIPVIVMTAHSDLDSAVSSYQGGAFEYLPKPFDVDEAISLVQAGGGTSSRSAPGLDSIRDAAQKRRHHR